MRQSFITSRLESEGWTLDYSQYGKISAINGEQKHTAPNLNTLYFMIHVPKKKKGYNDEE